MNKMKMLTVKTVNDSVLYFFVRKNNLFEICYENENKNIDEYFKITEEDVKTIIKFLRKEIKRQNKKNLDDLLINKNNRNEKN